MSVASVIVSLAARRDLIAINDYIRDELANPDAALRILRLLRDGIESLRDMPERGKPLTRSSPSTPISAFWCVRTIACSISVMAIR